MTKTINHGKNIVTKQTGYQIRRMPNFSFYYNGWNLSSTPNQKVRLKDWKVFNATYINIYLEIQKALEGMNVVFF